MGEYSAEHLEITGVVQGVGFRPFVYRLARRLGLSGRVCNVAGGVSIDVGGRREDLDAFRRMLADEAPPLARIESIDRLDRPSLDAPSEDFVIATSDDSGDRTCLVSPDICLCEACRTELQDPADRRYRYPFINCTDCGPRYTLIRDTPYDRPKTTMAHFALCPACDAEYRDPESRRFHAQPNACPVCGPRLEWRRGDAPPVFAEDALQAAVRDLEEGRIIAVKGIGGFHLACDATCQRAVAELRGRKARPHKPLALMVADLEVAARYVLLDEGARELLMSRRRPIVLLHQRADTDLCDEIAPGQSTLGLMLPYVPLHVLLLGEKPLVMTSGNLAGEPIVIDGEVAGEKLGAIADGFLDHDRPIETACDDSVLLPPSPATGGSSVLIRRARGWVPEPIELELGDSSPGHSPARPHPPLLAVGGELKAAFALLEEPRDGKSRAFLSQHLGDLANLETLEAFERTFDHLRRLFRIEPQAVACDLHPGYLSTDWARRFAAERGLPLVGVQHHHAHVASLIAERKRRGPVFGVAFDGTGYGADGTVWGGEILLADLDDFERVGHLRAVPLPASDQAIRRPRLLALAHLHAAGLEWRQDLEPVRTTDAATRRLLARQLERGEAALGLVSSSSMGRLFDAVAALLGLCQEASFEGQAAMELEALADAAGPEHDEVDASAYAFRLCVGSPPSGARDGALRLDPTPVFDAVVRDLRRDIPRGRLARRFHLAVAGGVARLLENLRTRHGELPVALTGGVLQNRLLLGMLRRGLAAAGFEVLQHRQVPPNDGGLALGQAAVAAVRLAGEQKTVASDHRASHHHASDQHQTAQAGKERRGSQP